MRKITTDDIKQFAKTVKPGQMLLANYNKRYFDRETMWPKYKMVTEYVEVKAAYPFFCLTTNDVSILWIDILKLMS